MNIIALGALAIGAIAMVLIMCKDYEDGLVGRMALCGIIISVLAVVCVSVAEPDRYADAPLEIKLLIASFLVFLTRHLFRFWHFTRRFLGVWQPRNPPSVEGHHQ